MYEDGVSTLNCVPSSEKTFEWKKGSEEEQENAKQWDERLTENQVSVNHSSSAFRVYNRVWEKNRYIPRQWTQEEFEAALPKRFKERKNSDKRQNIAVMTKNSDEIDQLNDDVDENTSSVLETSFEGTENEDSNEVMGTENELEECKDSEAKVRLDTEKTPVGIGEVNECEVLQNSQNAFNSFLSACLQGLLNTEAFLQVLTSPACHNFSSFESAMEVEKLKDLAKYVPSFDTPRVKSSLRQTRAEDGILTRFFDKISSQSKMYDHALASFLETLARILYGDTSEGQNTVPSVFRGQLCHAAVCQHCETVVREYESFMFLNPQSPQPISSENHGTLDIHVLSNSEGIWCVKSYGIPVSPKMLVIDLKEQLAGYQEFSGVSDPSSIRIGAVRDSRLKEVFDDMEDVRGMKLDPSSKLFAFRVLKCRTESTDYTNLGKETTQASKTSGMRGYADLSYHLYFNCGLCLNEGKGGSLLMHRSCGGMMCQDCLDEILQSNQDRCPCPICERPIDVEDGLCATVANAESETKEAHADVLCAVVFRTNRPRDSIPQLFGYPLLLDLPRKTTGYHLYRCIGYLLPKALAMKDKTSFTLHKVDKSGLRCGSRSCSLPSCSGCLVRIDDIMAVLPDTYFAVHFNDLADESRKDFGENFLQGTPQASKTQALFDRILHSCVDASSSKNALCPNCLHPSKTTSNITGYPKLLIIYLKAEYARKGLPESTTIANVRRFLIPDDGNEEVSLNEVKRSLTYQLVAAVLRGDDSEDLTFKPCMPGLMADKWMVYSERRVDEIPPEQLCITRDSVLFYEPVIDPGPGKPNTRELSSNLDGERKRKESIESGCLVHDTNIRDPYVINLLDATAASRPQTKSYSRKTSDSMKTDKRTKPSSSHLEPGEYILGNDSELDQPVLEGDVYGSQLSLGEVKKDVVPPKAIPATILDGIDTISPVKITDERDFGSRVLKETKKLATAVKREDAYGVVCSLKRGADPCLLVNDVSPLHLAAGIKSDQRRSMVAYLLKFSNNVNVPTSDGTTPLHVAAAWGHLDALELLLGHGAEPFDLTDIEGNSAFDLAANDCSAFLQSIYDSQRNSTLVSFSPLGNNLRILRTRKDGDGFRDKRLEDLVRSNAGLPSFVEDSGSSSTRVRRRRWLRRLRERSSGFLRTLRKMSSIRRRPRVGVVVSEITEDTTGENLL